MAAGVLCRMSFCNKLLNNAIKRKVICRNLHISARLSSDHYDVIISGGGMVGAAMAAALGHEEILADHKILLLEAGPPSTTPDRLQGYSSRVCALSPGTKQLLDSFGAWEAIQNMRCKEVTRMQVWESCTSGMISFDQHQLTDNLAYIVENNVILEAVTRQLDNCQHNVTVKHNSKVKHYHLDGEGDKPQLELEDGSILKTNLLIGADGFKSCVRETAGFHTVSWDYNQHALVATLKLAEIGENSVAWQRFLPTGPIAMLPLSDEYSCLIWSTTPEDAKTLMQLSPDSFADAVNNAFWTEDDKDSVVEYASRTFDSLLTTIGLDGSSGQQLPPTVINVEDGTRGMFPLALSHSSQYVRSRLALIGDAAHRVHPLAGQGVNLGFGDVTCLTKHISTAVYDGQDVGELNQLLDYETDRQRHVVPTMAAVDGLNRLYSTTFSPLVLLRTLGLQATNALTPLKNQMISHATR